MKDTKRCCDCKTVKPLGDFHNAPKSKHTDKHTSRCKECQSAYARAWRARNAESNAVKKAAWREQHRAEHGAWRANWRARKHGADNLPVETIIAILASTAGRCFYCRNIVEEDTVTIDHLVPLARGGAHSVENCAPSCLPCNAAKRKLTPLEWLLSDTPRSRVILRTMPTG